MGAELVEPFAKWGAALIAAGAAVWFIHSRITKAAKDEAELDETKEVLGAMERARKVREWVRRRTRRDRIDRM